MTAHVSLPNGCSATESSVKARQLAIARTLVTLLSQCVLDPARLTGAFDQGTTTWTSFEYALSCPLEFTAVVT